MRSSHPRSGSGDPTPTRRRGQSAVVGIVLLVGAVLVGATVLFLVGGSLLEDIQSSSEGELARDTARQAHASLSEAAATGQSRIVPDPDGAVDARVVPGGTLNVSMRGGGGTCSASVSEALGAIEYEAGGRTFVYEGGAIWADTEAGLAVERAPPISHDPADGTRISVLAISANASDGTGQLTAIPDETERERISRAIEEMLLQCPAAGHTDLRINVTSPYAAVWADHFREAVVTSSNVTLTSTDRWVRATITNATAAHPARGLQFEDVDADARVPPGEAFDLAATVSNDGSTSATAELTLDVDGRSANRTASVPVNASGTAATNLSIPAGALAGLSPGVYDYTLVLDHDDTTTTVPGSFYLAGSTGGVDVDVSHSPAVPTDSVTVTATLTNHGTANLTRTVTLDPPGGNASGVSSPVPVTAPGYGGVAEVPFVLNVSGLSGGTYTYEVATNESETATGSITVAGGTASGRTAGDLRLEFVDHTGNVTATDESFGVDVRVTNDGGATTSGAVSLGLPGIAPATRNVTLDSGDSTTVTLAVGSDRIDDLATGRVHPYDVVLTEGNDTAAYAGDVYVGAPGAALGIENATAVVGNDTVTIEATFANDGIANGSEVATLTLSNPGAGDVASSTTPVRVRRGTTRTVAFELNASRLAGTYTYDIAYAGDAASGSFAVSALVDNGSGVTTDVAGEGTVTVLGTEVSAEWQSDSLTWIKHWAPTSVTTVVERNGTPTEHPVENDQATADAIEDPRNLNTYDTQAAQYEWSWEQDAGEVVHVTLRSTLWEAAGGYEHVNQRTEGWRTWEDYQPADGLGDASRVVDERTDSHPQNVQILRDGDRVPDVSGVSPDQRNASEILNQGAANRIDPDTGELDLGRNERVVLFEMTTTTDQVPGNMWEYALNNDVSDPDYNDVIALVEFEAAGLGDTLSPVVSPGPNGTGLTFAFPGVDSGDGGTVDATAGNASEYDAPATAEPDPGDTGGGGTSLPDDVSVEVDVVGLR